MSARHISAIPKTPAWKTPVKGIPGCGRLPARVGAKDRAPKPSQKRRSLGGFRCRSAGRFQRKSAGKGTILGTCHRKGENSLGNTKKSTNIYFRGVDFSGVQSFVPTSALWPVTYERQESLQMRSAEPRQQPLMILIVIVIG